MGKGSPVGRGGGSGEGGGGAGGAGTEWQRFAFGRIRENALQRKGLWEEPQKQAIIGSGVPSALE